MKRAVSVLSTFLTLTFVGTMQSFAQDNERPMVCVQSERIEIPSADLPTAEDRTTLASCDSQDLYFGIDNPADPVKARKCAYLERERQKQTGQAGILDGDLGGAGVLTMIYANGKGAARSFDLALKFACECDAEEGDAEEKAHSRIEHLLKLQQERWTGTDFKLCDEINNSFSEPAVACRQLQERIDQAARTARLGKITANWTPKEKEALADLQHAADAFFTARSENEVEFIRVHAGQDFYNDIVEMDARAPLNDAFIAALERLEQGQVPKFSAAQFRQIDAELNSTYAGKIHSADEVVDPDTAPSTVTSEGLRTAQRAWLRYREAWVAFGRVKYPGVSAESLRASLTQERIKMLEGL